MGTGSTGQNHNHSVFWWLEQQHWVLFATRIWCSSGFLLCRIYVAPLNSPEELKSGTAISPENESYSWSLHQTVQSLQASSQLLWKLLNTRDEDRSVFLPQPCHRIALAMSLGSHLNFPLGSLWPETCTKNCTWWTRYLTPNPRTKFKQQHKLVILLMKARFSQRSELLLWSKPALMRGQLQLNRSSSLLCQYTFHVFCFCSTADVAHEAEAVSSRGWASSPCCSKGEKSSSWTKNTWILLLFHLTDFRDLL